MADINVENLEPNSHKYKAEKAREKASPIIDRSQVVSTKKPLGKKFAETFISEDVDYVKTWLVWDVLIPGVKNTILDIISMAFFGEVMARNGRGGKTRRERESRVNYRSYYGGPSERGGSRYRRDDKYNSDNHVDFRNIILLERAAAEDVIEEMRRRIRDTNSVSVAELLDLIGEPSRYTDNNWGWDDERDIGIRRVSSGYLIDVAEPKYLD